MTESTHSPLSPLHFSHLSCFSLILLLLYISDAALLSGSTRPCLTSSFSAIQHPRPHSPQYMHMRVAVHVLTMCSLFLLPDLSLSSPFSLWLIFWHTSSLGTSACCKMTPCPKHTYSIHFVSSCITYVSPHMLLVLVGLWAQGKTRHGNDSSYIFLSCCFDWLREVNPLMQRRICTTPMYPIKDCYYALYILHTYTCRHTL